MSKRFSIRNGIFNFGRNNVLLSVLMVVIGLILVIWPGTALRLAAQVLGVALLVAAVIFGISWYQDRHLAQRNDANLALAIVGGLLGIVVLIAPKAVISIIPWIVGLVILLNGVINLAQALDQRKAGDPRWIIALVLAVLTLILGLIILSNPFRALTAPVVVVGLVFLYNGVSNLWIESRYRKMDRW